MEGRQYIIATVMITIVMMLVSSSRFGAGESHSKHVPYDVQVPKEICLQVSACAYLRWWWIYCKWITRIRCTTIYVKEIRYRTECLDGWSGGNCDKPICNRCMPGYTCVAPDKCECMSSGGACTSVPCSTQISCFPGTCISGSCRCPTHFAGDDCLSFGRIPDIESCEVTLQDDNKVLAKALCGYKNIEPTEVIINSTRLSQIYMHMEAKAPPNIELPPSSDLTHIKFPVKLGVANAGFKIYKNGTFAKKIECHINRNDAKDYHKCDQRESGQSLDLEHGSKIVIAAFASLGGTKEGSRITDNDNSHFSKVTFTGDESWRKIVFRVDTKPPVHCFTTNCNFFPIQLERDVTSESEIKAEFHGWDDKDSGIKMFHIEVYLMNLSPDDQFEKLGKPIVTRDMLPNDPDFNHFIFICIKSGVYSVELTVYDGANNKAKARNIFVYTGSNKLETNPERPVQIESAKRNNKTGEYWLTDEGFHMRENMLSISWEGHFVSEARFSDEWSKPVRPWGAEGIDDERRSEDFGIGLRTIGKMRNLPNGITNYSLAYYVDEDKDGIAENYTEHVNLQSTECSHDIDIVTSKLGSTIGIVLIAYDVAGGSRKETFKVRIDTTAPTLTNWSLLPNDPDIYTSRVAIQTMDKESGIDSIRFKVLQVLDGPHEVLLKSGEAEIIKKSPPHLSDRVVYKRETSEKPCEKGHGDCYCTAYRSCFSVRQFITIDHCWIDRQVKAKNRIAIDFEVLNQAGLTTGVKRLWLSNLEESHCRPVLRSKRLKVKWA